jgi:hypothetical protein
MASHATLPKKERDIGDRREPASPSFNPEEEVADPGALRHACR